MPRPTHRISRARILLLALGVSAIGLPCGARAEENAADAKPAVIARRAPEGAPAESAAAARTVANAIADDYQIGPYDQLLIQVYQADLLTRTVRVSAGGYISMPLIGIIEVAGLTAMELERLLAAKLEETYMQEPQVSVYVGEQVSQRVTIEGYVKNPGVYPLKGRTTLVQAIAMGAGMDYLADISTIRLFRTVKGERQSFVYDLDAIRGGKAEDPVVRGDDIIVVDASGTKSVVKGITDTIRGIFGVYH